MLYPGASAPGYSGKESAAMRKHLSTILLILVFLTGLSLLLYPSVSDYWNGLHQSRAIVEYAQSVSDIDQARYDQTWAAAEAYNRALWDKEDRYQPSETERAEYEALLDISGGGVMGYIEIPSIKCSLPICHGTSDAVLQHAIGHIEGSSLPVGGTGTHCVLSGHRGLPSARLFTDLDKLGEGDTFLLRVLDETLTYEVDQILIVKPNELSALEIEADSDYCTLVTCTPYGINTHRLLVRGRRVENQTQAASIRVTADAMQIEPVIVAPLVAAPMLLLLLVWLMVRSSGRGRRPGGPNEGGKSK